MMQTKDDAKFHIVLVKGWIHKDGKFLLARRSEKEIHKGGAWSTPGGKVERDPNKISIIEETLKAEIREEVGLEIEDNPLLFFNKSFERVDGAHVVGLVYLCEYKSGKARPLEDTAEVAWVGPEEMEEYIKTQEYLREEWEALRNYIL